MTTIHKFLKRLGAHAATLRLCIGSTYELSFLQLAAYPVCFFIQKNVSMVCGMQSRRMHARRPSRRAQTLRWRCSCTMKSRKRLSAAAGKRPATRRSRSRRPRPPEPGSPARQVRPGPMDPRGRDNRMQTLLDVRRRLPPLQAPLSLTKAGLYASLADAPLDECLSIPCWGNQVQESTGDRQNGDQCSCLWANLFLSLPPAPKAWLDAATEQCSDLNVVGVFQGPTVMDTGMAGTTGHRLLAAHGLVGPSRMSAQSCSKHQALRVGTTCYCQACNKGLGVRFV